MGVRDKEKRCVQSSTCCLWIQADTWSGLQAGAQPSCERHGGKITPGDHVGDKESPVVWQMWKQLSFMECYLKKKPCLWTVHKE